MTRRKLPPPPASTTTGPISISVPMAALLEQNIGVAKFIEMATQGQLDRSGRGHKFTTSSIHLAQYDIEIPPMPQMQGDITWRRKQQCWSIDFSTVEISDEWRWWEMLARDTGDAQLRVQNVQLPQTIIEQVEGHPLIEILEHPYFTDPGIIIRRAVNYKATSLMGTDSPACVEFKLDVPRIIIQR